jgi:uncharacterized protein (DUF1330 family)
MDTKLTLIVMLFLNAGHESDFEDFESSAAEIMRRHGGAIERRVRCAGRADSGEPYEVHIVTFPDQQALDRYREDPDLQRLAALRAKSIHHTVVWQGLDLI